MTDALLLWNLLKYWLKRIHQDIIHKEWLWSFKKDTMLKLKIIHIQLFSVFYPSVINTLVLLVEIACENLS